jgi:hypothetical protein
MIVSDSKTIVVQKIFSLEPIEIILDGQQRLPAPSSAIQVRLSNKPLWVGSPLSGTGEEPRSMRKNLKPSSRFVLLALTIHGAGTQEDLAKQTSLNSRTIRRALEELTAQRLASKRQFGKDKRQYLYHSLITRQMQHRYLEETKPGHVPHTGITIERLKKRLLP